MQSQTPKLNFLLCNEEKQSRPQPVSVRTLQIKSSRYRSCASTVSQQSLSWLSHVEILTNQPPRHSRKYFFWMTKACSEAADQSLSPLRPMVFFHENFVFWSQNILFGCYSLSKATEKHISPFLLTQF